MIKHYLTIALRNIRKYKAQTAISVCAMAVSMSLMAIITSFLTHMFGAFSFDEGHASRMEQLMADEDDQYIDDTTLSLVLGHQFENVEDIHYHSTNRYTVNVAANPGSPDEQSMLSSAIICDYGFLSFGGLKSAKTGRNVSAIDDGGIVITEWQARKLYGDANPIGSSMKLLFYFYEGAQMEKTFVVRDVIREPGMSNTIAHSLMHIFFTDGHLPSGRYKVYFLLREGYSADDLAKELSAISDGKLSTANVGINYKKSNEDDILRRNIIILFLFLFVCVSFSSYLRQECQLFRLREREVAIRTCCGGKPIHLFGLLYTEIAIVLLATLALSACIDLWMASIVNSYFTVLTEETVWTISGTIATEAITTLALALISAIAVFFTIRRIRNDQTGLAMRMKPTPKHRLRNFGITLQMIISLFFATMVILLLSSKNEIMQGNRLPKDLDDFKKQLLVKMNAVTQAEENEVYDKIKHIEAVDRIYTFYYYMTSYDVEDAKGDNSRYVVYIQQGNDMVDFYNVSTTDLPDYNPDRNILVSEDFKKFLENNGLWNGRTVRVDGADYDLRGTFKQIPYDKVMSTMAVIISENSEKDHAPYDRIIIPKEGKEDEAKAAISDVLREVFPSRIDVGTEPYFYEFEEKYQLIMSMITIIDILAVVSIVTTVATIYASVSLDTRRRRKEMALRKLNGAKGKVIGRLFLRTYVTILAVAAIVVLPICLLIGSSSALEINGIESGTQKMLLSFLAALALVIAITALTIFWKIRRIMDVDPIEYLKS